MTDKQVMDIPGEGDTFDFGLLPDVVWVKVMSYLPLSDRYRLSQTCRVLSDVFRHPSLWHTVVIHFTGSESNYVLRETIVMRRYYHMVKEFGHCFQNLTLCLSGHFCTLPDEWKNTIHELGERCHLESLTLEIGVLTSLFHLHGYQPFKQDVRAILSAVRNAFRLKKIHLKSWPMLPATFNDPEQNIFNALMENEKLKNLECLTLFRTKATEWSERQPLLPSPEFTLDVVSHFRNLTQLGLRSPMLNDDIIAELATPGRAKLQLLQIFLNYAKYNKDYEVPKISSSTWTKFVKRNLDVQVELTMMSRIPLFNLGYFLKPEAPLGEISVMKYSQCNAEFLESLTQKYSKTLQNFTCYCDPDEVDTELLDMAEKCTRLRTFIFHGNINYTTVTKLAQVRGREWLKFEVVGDMISTKNEEFSDDDRVIAKGEDGEYFLCSVVKYHGRDEDRDLKFSQMNSDVSRSLGYNWYPL